MQAFTIDSYGSSLTATSLPAPEPGPGQIAVRTAAAGVNHADERTRTGEFKALFPLTLPATLGGEMSGTVSAVGDGVTQFSVGDEVYAYTGFARTGAFAETVVIDADAAAPKPSGVTMTEAAALPVGALTAWQALVDLAGVEAGQTVLVHGGAGGVGSLTIQLAKHLGATVATTASAKNAEFVRALGADIVIDHRSEDFVERLADQPVDVVVDTQGGDVLDDSLAVLRPGGIAIGLSGPPDVDFADEVGANFVVKNVLRVASAPVRRRARSHGVRYRFLFIHPDGAALRTIARLVDDGVLTANVGTVMPFEQTPAALERVVAGDGRGKVVVTTTPDSAAAE